MMLQEPEYMHRMRLSSAERDRLASSHSVDEMVPQLRTILFSDEVFAKLVAVGDPELVLIENLPVEKNLPAEPTRTRVDRERFVSELFLEALSQVMDCFVSYNPAQPKEGFISNIYPRSEYKNIPSTHSIEPMWFHVDNPFREHKPDFLALYTLVPDTSSQTAFIRCDSLLAQVPVDVLTQMGQPEYRFKSGDTFGFLEDGVFPIVGTSEDGVCSVRILEETQWIEPLTPKAQGGTRVPRGARESVPPRRAELCGRVLGRGPVPDPQQRLGPWAYRGRDPRPARAGHKPASLAAEDLPVQKQLLARPRYVAPAMTGLPGEIQRPPFAPFTGDERAVQRASPPDLASIRRLHSGPGGLNSFGS